MRSILLPAKIDDRKLHKHTNYNKVVHRAFVCALSVLATPLYSVNAWLSAGPAGQGLPVILVSQHDMYAV